MAQGGDLLDWTSDHGIQEDAFIQRIEALSTMGYSVLLSNYRRYFKVANYLATFTRESIVIALGLPSLVVRTPLSRPSTLLTLMQTTPWDVCPLAEVCLFRTVPASVELLLTSLVLEGYGMGR